MTTTVVTTLRLDADLYSSVSVYDDQAPIWGFTSRQVGHRTGLRQHAERLRKDQQ